VTCAANARCIVSGGSPQCQCSPGYEGPADTCVAIIDPCVAAGTCPEGAWVRRALPGIVDGRDSIQSVLVDPVRPSDFYAFSGSNGGPTVKVYVSTDFGDTWEDRNTTAGYTGNPWGVSIDPNPNRDPSTPPTLWSPSGYGANGAWKSVDGGRSWVRSAGADAAFGPYNPAGDLLTVLYHIAILPDDPPNHVLATYHYGFKDVGDGGFGETWDGGGTWVIHPPPANIGTSHYVIPISGTTWAVIAQDADGRNGIWRTTTAGRVGGTAERSYRDGTISTAAWAMVDNLEHAHGSHQNLTLPDGRILVTGNTNGAVSSDQGATWTHFTADGNWAPPRQFQTSQMTNIAATARFAYTNFLANTVIARAPLNNLVGAEKLDPRVHAGPRGHDRGRCALRNGLGLQRRQPTLVHRRRFLQRLHLEVRRTRRVVGEFAEWSAAAESGRSACEPS
jgi:EGF-like domain